MSIISAREAAKISDDPLAGLLEEISNRIRAAALRRDKRIVYSLLTSVWDDEVSRNRIANTLNMACFKWRHEKTKHFILLVIDW